MIVDGKRMLMAPAAASHMKRGAKFTNVVGDMLSAVILGVTVVLTNTEDPITPNVAPKEVAWLYPFKASIKLAIVGTQTAPVSGMGFTITSVEPVMAVDVCAGTAVSVGIRLLHVILYTDPGYSLGLAVSATMRSQYEV
jgi:hypothetical protein